MKDSLEALGPLDERDLLALAATGLLEPAEVEAAGAARAADPNGAAALEAAFLSLAASQPAPPLPAEGWERLQAALDAVQPMPLADPAAPRIAVACVYCHDALSRPEARYCASCLAPHHAECFAAHTRCAAPGCGEVATVQAFVPAPVAAPVRSARRAPWILSAACLVGGALVAWQPWGRGPNPLATPPLASSSRAPTPTPSPSEVERFLRDGERALAAGDLATALEAFEEVVALAPSEPPGYLGRAAVRERQGRIDEQLRDLERAWARASGSAARLECGLRLAQATRASGAYEQARATLAELTSLSLRLPADLDPDPARQAAVELAQERELLELTWGDPYEAELDPAAAAQLRRSPDPELARDDWGTPELGPLWRARLASALRADDASSVAALTSFAGRGAPSAAEAFALAARGLARAERQPDAAWADVSLAASRDAESSFVLAARGAVLARAGERERARQLLDEAAAVARNGTSLASRQFRRGLELAALARRTSSEGLYLSARRALAQAWLLDPLHLEALLERSRLYSHFGAAGAARASALRATRLDPGAPAAHEWLGFVLLAADELAAAEASFRRAIELSPAGTVGERPFGPAHALYGRALAAIAGDRQALLTGVGTVTLRDGRTFESVRYRQEEDVLVLTLNFGEVRVPRGEVALLRHEADLSPRAPGPARRLEQAESDLARAIALTPARYPAATPTQIRRRLAYQTTLVELLRSLDRPAETEAAEAARRETERGAQEAAAVLLRRASAQADELAYREAIEQLDLAVELGLDRSEVGRVFELRGRCYLKLGSLVPGLLDYAVALERDPSLLDALLSKLYQLSYVIDLGRALDEVDRVAGEQPGSHVYLVRGLLRLCRLEFAHQDPDDAAAGERDLSRALALRPSLAARLLRGVLRERAALPPEGARADLEQVLAERPECVGAWVSLARLRTRLGDPEAACAALEALLRDPAARPLEVFDQAAFAPLKTHPRFQALRAEAQRRQR